MTTYLPHPRARQAVRAALSHYPCGLSHAELRRRCGRLVHAIDEDGRNVTEDLAVVVEYLLDEQLVEQRVIGRTVRFVDCVTYPTHPEENTETPS